MGCCKQLLPLGCRPVIVCCLEAVLNAGLQDVLVVTGANGEAVAAAISHLPVKIVRNQAAAGDMAESVRTGLGAIADRCTGVMICLADQPLVGSDTYRDLQQRHTAGPHEILIPTFRGKRGHPTVFPVGLLNQLLAGGTLRDVIHTNQHAIRQIELPDSGVVRDMDIISDYEAMKIHFTTLVRAPG
nr:nucleotidyltransferase family protein [uncultured Thiodictyon sp.]